MELFPGQKFPRIVPGISAQATHILKPQEGGPWRIHPPTRPRPCAAAWRRTTRDLAAARAGFDHTADPDLLEYYLYEISALGAKHTYLLRQMKSAGPEDAPGP